MSYQDFNAPIKYTPPEPQERNFRQLIIGVAVLVVVGLLGFGVLTFTAMGSASLDKRETRLVWLTSVEPAKVAVGTPKTWRTLANTKPVSGAVGHVRPPAVVGHFRSSSNDSVLLIGMDTPTYTYEADGKGEVVPNARFDSITRFTAWDYDHDGTDELVPATVALAYLRNVDFPVISYGETGHGAGWSIDTADGQSAHLKLDMRSDFTPLYTIKGKERMSLSGGYTFGQIIYGDLDGDGWRDMLIRLNKVVDTFSVFGGPRGDHIRDIKPESNAKSCFCGDLEGTGKQTLVNLEAGQLVAYDIRGDRKMVAEGWPDDYFPTLAVDLTGDHVDEVLAINSGLETPESWDQGRGKFKPAEPPRGVGALPLNEWWQQHCAPRGGYFNPKTKQWVAFKFPAGPVWSFNLFQGVPDEVAIGNFGPDDKKQIALRASVGSAIFMFDVDGNCTYYEEFGEPVFAMGKVRSGGKDYLMVQTPSKLLIWP